MGKMGNLGLFGPIRPTSPIGPISPIITIQEFMSKIVGDIIYAFGFLECHQCPIVVVLI